MRNFNLLNCIQTLHIFFFLLLFKLLASLSFSGCFIWVFFTFFLRLYFGHISLKGNLNISTFVVALLKIKLKFLGWFLAILRKIKLCSTDNTNGFTTYNGQFWLLCLVRFSIFVDIDWGINLKLIINLDSLWCLLEHLLFRLNLILSTRPDDHHRGVLSHCHVYHSQL